MRHIQSSIVEAFGVAHESETHVDFALEVEMDIFKNTIGRVLGNQNYNKSDNELANIVKNELDNGGLKYLKPINYDDPCFKENVCSTIPQGTHGITSSTQLIPTNQ